MKTNEKCCLVLGPTIDSHNSKVSDRHEVAMKVLVTLPGTNYFLALRNFKTLSPQYCFMSPADAYGIRAR